MKVKISETVDVSDEQRLAIAKTLHGAGAKKDHATREELKDFVWRGGRDWALLLQRSDEFAADLPSGDTALQTVPEPDGMDLI